MKVVINRCYGGFSLSKKAYDYLGIPWDGYGYKFRDDEDRAFLLGIILLPNIQEITAWAAKI